MIRKFDLKKDKSIAKNLPFLYETSLPNLVFAGYILQRNKSSEIVIQDVLYPNNFPYIFLPRKKSLWENSHILWADENDIKKIDKDFNIYIKKPLGYEYYYKTSDYLKLEGKKMSSIRRHINQFVNKNNYKIKYSYPRNEIDVFVKKWVSQQKEKTLSFNGSLEWFRFCLKNAKKFNIKQIFLEVDDKLVGIAQGVKFDSKRWVGLHLKVDYGYKGASRFLFQKRVELFKDYDEFTVGHSGAGDKGIEKFKEEMHPSRKVEHFYIMTGEKK